MKLSLFKKTHKIKKPKDEVSIRRVWVRIYTIFTVLHLVALLVLSYFSRELVRGIDAPVEALPQSKLGALEVLDSKLSVIEARIDTKTHSLLEAVKEEELKQVVVPQPSQEEIKPVL